MMHPKSFEAESLNPKVESGGQVTPKFGCEVPQNGADSHWLKVTPVFGGYVTSAPTIEAFAIKYRKYEGFPMKTQRNQRFSYVNTTGQLRPV